MGFSKYPLSLDDDESLPKTVDLITPVKAEVVNRLRDSIIATQTELGTNPSSTFGTVKARLDQLSSSIEGLANSTATESDFTSLTTQVNSIQTNLNSHTSSVSNPHSVTAAQVGSPTTASFLSHTSNASNPHGVTAAQVGATGVVNPSTDTALVRFNGISGQQQNSTVLLDGSGNINNITSASFGTDPATTGNIRLSNENTIYARTSGSINARLIFLDGSNNFNIGDSTNIPSTFIDASGLIGARIDGTIQFQIDESTIDSNLPIHIASGAEETLLQIGTPGDDPGVGVPIIITLPTRNADKVWSIAHAPYVSQGEDNYILQVGFNADGSGQNLNSSFPTWCTQWESSFVNGPGGPTLSEWHVLYLSAGGGAVQRRPLTVAIDQDTNLGDVVANGQFTVNTSDESIRRLRVFDSLSDSSIIIGANVTGGGTGIIFDRNNIVALQQRGAGAYNCQIARIDSGDGLILGGTNTSNVYIIDSGANIRLRSNGDGVAASSFIVGGSTVPGNRNDAAILEASSTTQGFLPPRMTEVQRDDIATPPEGLLIHNTTSNSLEVFNGTNWTSATTSPATTTDNAIARWDGTEGNLQDSSIIIDDSDNASGFTTIAFGTTPSTSGDIRLESGFSITHRNGADALNYNVLAVDGSDNLNVGSSGPSLALLASGAARVIVTNVNAEIRVPSLFFRSTTSNPQIYQADDSTASVTGDTLTIHAQNCTGTSTTGGSVVIRPGSGTASNGEVDIQDALGGSRIRLTSSHVVSLAGNLSVTSSSVGIAGATVNWGASSLNPTLSQANDTTASATGDTLTIAAQNCTGTTTTGGDLTLNAGSGTTINGDVNIGAINTNVVNVGPPLEVNTAAGTVAAAGDIRMRNTGIIASKTSGGTDTDLIQLNGSNVFIMGDSGVTAEITSSSTINIRIAAALRAQFNAGGLSILQNDLQFTDAATAPHVYQATKVASGTGDTFTINAQDSEVAGTTNVGGALLVRAGNAANATTNTGGNLTLQPGSGADAGGVVTVADASGTSRITVDDNNVTLRLTSGLTGVRLADTFIDFYVPNIIFDDTMVAPEIYQNDDVNNSVTGDTFTIRAQDCTGTTSTGGDLHLRPGTGTSTNGELELQDAGGVDRLLIASNGNVITDPTSNLFVRINGSEAMLFGADYLRFDVDVVSPQLYQETENRTNSTGDTFTISAQDVTGGGTTQTGGTLSLKAGDADAGTAATLNGGDITIRPGNGDTGGSAVIMTGDSTPRLTIDDTLITLGHSFVFFDDVLEANALIGMLPESTRDGYDLFIQAQETSLASGTAGSTQILGGAGSGSSGIGGDVLVVGGTGTGTNASGGHVYIAGGSENGSGIRGSVSLISTTNTDFGSGEGIVFLGNSTTVPTLDPTSGGFLYAEGGAGKWRGSSGTVTTFGPADPRCDKCGLDFVVDAENSTEGWHKSICLNCLMGALTKAGIDPDEYVMKDIERNK